MSYKVITLGIENISIEVLDAIKVLAMKEFNCLGINEYSMDENQVDSILGDKSYCGGDVTDEVLEEVEISNSSASSISFYFLEFEEFFVDYISKHIPQVKFKVETHQTEDWNEQWRAHFKKIVISEKMDIVPSWEQKSKKDDVLIYPGMGFGTGSHQTTYLCLKLMMELKNINTVLDHGCGSSILGLAAYNNFRDISKIDLYDIDEQAYINSIQNMDLNKTDDRVSIIKPEEKDILTGSYDLVFANILLHVLIAEKEFIINRTKKNGSIIISGLLNEQVEEFLENFKPSGVELVKSVLKDDWSALLLKKI